MKQKIKISELVQVTDLKNYYENQNIDELVISIENEGLKVPITVTSGLVVVDGYRRIQSMEQLGETEIDVRIEDVEPTIYERLVRNMYRRKTTMDEINDIKNIFKKYPSRQGKRKLEGKYSRYEEISKSLNNRWKDSSVIKKLEYVLNNDIENHLLTQKIIEGTGDVIPSYEFLKVYKPIDEKKKYGYTDLLKKGVLKVSDVNKLIGQMEEISKGINYTFKIPEKGYSYKGSCLDLVKMDEHKGTVDLLLTSPPYYILRKYQDEESGNKNKKINNEEEPQLGHEKTSKEYCDNVSKIINKLIPTLKKTSNVMINIGETYDNGVGYGIPQMLKQSIQENTNLIYKDTLIWSKPNPKPQNETVQRPINNVEYILWFVIDPDESKYKMLTYPVENKKPKRTRGAKDIDKKGNVNKNNQSISKPYGKIYNHLKEQEIEKIINCSVGKNHEVYKICSEGHPAIMSSLLPVIPILMTTDESDVVLDPFSGSNVVGRMSLLLNRRFLSTEKSEKYFKIGCELLKRSNEEFNPKDLDTIQSVVYQLGDQELKIAA